MLLSQLRLDEWTSQASACAIPTANAPGAGLPFGASCMLRRSTKRWLGRAVPNAIVVAIGAGCTAPEDASECQVGEQPTKEAPFTLLAATPHGQANGGGIDAHPTNWTRLSTGGWVGLNGGWLCNLNPHDRTTTTCVRMQLGQDVPPGYTDPITLTVSSDESLWAMFRVNPNDRSIPTGVSLGRYDGNDRFAGPFVPLTLDTCDMLLGLN